MTINSKAELLAYLARQNPRLWEILHPHVPKVSLGTRQLMAAMVVKSISREVADRAMAKSLNEVGKSLFSEGTRAMNYEDDDWCGTPWPHKFPGGNPVDPDPVPWRFIFHNDVMFDPQPDPPVGQLQAFYGATLITLADAVGTSQMAGRLQELGNALMKNTVKPAPFKDAVADGVK
jgi:hypothetical protein